MTTSDDRPAVPPGPTPEEQDGPPAWADGEAFAGGAQEDGLEAFVREQADLGDEPQPTGLEGAQHEPAELEPIEPALPTEPIEPAQPTEPEPVEPAPPSEPGPVPFEAPGPEPLEAPGPEPLAEEPSADAARPDEPTAESADAPTAESAAAADEGTPRHDTGSQVPGSALTGDQVAGERVVPPSAPPVLPHVPAPPVVAGDEAADEAGEEPGEGAGEEPAAAPVDQAASEPAVDEEEPEPLADVVAVPAPRPATRPLVAAVALLAVVAVVLGLLAWRAAGPGPVQDDRDAALDAARSAARAVFSYDYRHLDKDFAAGKALTTGGFRKEYERTTGKLVEGVAAQYKAVVVADVGAAAVVTATHGRVLVLVYVDQQSSSTLAAQPKLTQSRLEMTMVHRGGHWLVEKIRAF